MVSGAVVSRDKLGYRAAYSQVEQAEIAYKRSYESPDPVRRRTQFPEDIGTQEEADDRAEEEGSPIGYHVPYESGGDVL